MRSATLLYRSSRTPRIPPFLNVGLAALVTRHFLRPHTVTSLLCRSSALFFVWKIRISPLALLRADCIVGGHSTPGVYPCNQTQRSVTGREDDRAAHDACALQEASPAQFYGVGVLCMHRPPPQWVEAWLWAVRGHDRTRSRRVCSRAGWSSFFAEALHYFCMLLADVSFSPRTDGSHNGSLSCSLLQRRLFFFARSNAFAQFFSCALVTEADSRGFPAAYVDVFVTSLQGTRKLSRGICNVFGEYP